MTTHFRDLTDEDMNKLEIGEFKDDEETRAYSTSEVAIMLQHRQKTLQGELPEVFHKTNEYVRTFSRFKSKADNDTANQIIDQIRGLHDFERALLANLVPESSDEAMALIPSLIGKVPEEDLDKMLKDLAKLNRM